MTASHVSLINVEGEEDQANVILNRILPILPSSDKYPLTINVILYTLTQFEFQMKPLVVNSLIDIRFIHCFLKSELERIYEKRYRSLSRAFRNHISKSEIDQHAVDVSENDDSDDDFHCYYTAILSHDYVDEFTNWDSFEITWNHVIHDDNAAALAEINFE
jgi:hypothetical protein